MYVTCIIIVTHIVPWCMVYFFEHIIPRPNPRLPSFPVMQSSEIFYISGSKRMYLFAPNVLKGSFLRHVRRALRYYTALATALRFLHKTPTFEVN